MSGSHRLPALGARLLTLLFAASLVMPAAALASGSPPIPGADTITTTEDHAAVTGNVLTNDTDPETDALTVASADPATLGTLVVEADGDYTFTPAANLNGSETVKYYVSDGSNEPVAGDIAITVTAVNDAPVAVDDTVTATEDTLLTITTLLDNDTDVEGSTLWIPSLSNASGGTFSWVNGTTVKWTPAKDACGTAVGRFDYEVREQGSALHDYGRVTVDVTCVNDPPAAVDDVAAAVTGGPAVDIAAATNDTDVDDSGLTVTEVGAVSPLEAGAAAVVGGLVHFTPAAAFEGTATVDYTVSDGELTDTGTITITVAVAPDTTDPVITSLGATFGSGRVNESVPVKITWAGTDASGITGYEVRVSVGGAAETTIYTGPGTSMSKLFAFDKSLVFRVRATDGAANVSGWTTLTRKAVDYQAPGSSAIRYRGTWTTVRNSGDSGVGSRYTTTKGKSATLTFTGREVVYVAPKRSSERYVKIYVDGAYQGRYSLYASTTHRGQIIFRKAFAYGSHTIKVVNDTAGRRAYVDAFVVLR